MPQVTDSFPFFSRMSLTFGKAFPTVADMSKRVILPGAVRAIREAKAETDGSFKLGQFATKCLLSSSHLCNIEADRKGATEEVIHRIAAHLGVPVSAISYEKPEEAAS